MTELRYYEQPVVDCSDFDRFVEEVYGRRYSTVAGYRGSDRLGHYTYDSVNVEEWKHNKEYEASEEHKQWVKEFEEKYGSRFDIELQERPSFEEWYSKESIAEQHNNSPVIDEVVYHLIKDGHNVPARFTVLVDW